MYQMTDKEKQIVLLIMQGATNAEIAQALNVQKNTIGAYIYKLCRIYEARNRIDLVNKVKERGV